MLKGSVFRYQSLGHVTIEAQHCLSEKNNNQKLYWYTVCPQVTAGHHVIYSLAWDLSVTQRGGCFVPFIQ